MKVWIGHGSEHSYDLVLIGYFVDETKARRAEEQFKRLKEAAESEFPEPSWETDQRVTDGIYELLKELKMYDLSRSDIENFIYEHTVERKGKKLYVKTDEGEISGFLKVFISGGARIEIYSPREWTADGQHVGDETDGESGSTEEG